jgi:uncharacterized protein (TIGR03437 family)
LRLSRSPGTVTCVANAASSDNTSTAPGEILSIYGTGIGPALPTSPQCDQNGNVTKSLGGITITFDGIPAPILFAAPGQINLVAPFSLQPGTTHIELRNSGTLVLAIDWFTTPTVSRCVAILCGRIAGRQTDNPE